MRASSHEKRRTIPLSVLVLTISQSVMMILDGRGLRICAIESFNELDEDEAADEDEEAAADELPAPAPSGRFSSPFEAIPERRETKKREEWKERTA